MVGVGTEIFGAVHEPTTHWEARLAPGGDCVLAGHDTQLEANALPVVVEYILERQSVHGPDPVSGLYFPAAHNWHVPPSGPVLPTGHSAEHVEEAVDHEYSIPLEDVESASDINSTLA